MKNITCLYKLFLRTIYIYGMIYHNILKGILMVDYLFNEELLQQV